MRFPDWPADGWRPHLDDVIVQTDGPDGDPDELERAYRIVGIVETRTGYRFLAERIAYDDVADASRRIWPFFNVPRR